MAGSALSGEWDIIISTLQDIAGLSGNLEKPLAKKVDELSLDELKAVVKRYQVHKESIEKCLRLVQPLIDNTSKILVLMQNVEEETPLASQVAGKRKRPESSKKGRSFFTSPYNPSEPIILGSEVAFKPRNGIQGDEWIQCRVMKVVDTARFDVRDPEPDENNNPGKTYRCTWKEVILVPPVSDLNGLMDYPSGTKVLARYPETTTFYPAEVLGSKVSKITA